jgi:hypothetical protein
MMQSVRIFNMAKRAVVKDRRVFESLGYPKEFEKVSAPRIADAVDAVYLPINANVQIADEVEEVYGHEPSYKSGTFRIIGDKYEAPPPSAACVVS